MNQTQSFRTISFALLLIACHSRQPATPGHVAGIPEGLALSVTGTYSGHYSKGLITLVINYISGGIASGYDIHKGLRRNLNGEVTQKGGQLSFVLKEPGGNPYDGTFFLNLDTASKKITGKWVPTDSTKAHSGRLDLARADEKDNDEYADSWEGNLGELIFYNNGTCSLEYYPSKDDNSQLITVHGSYEKNEDTIRIEWQRNSRTPVLNMKLIQKPMIEGNDSVETVPPRLQGNGVKFAKSMAG